MDEVASTALLEPETAVVEVKAEQAVLVCDQLHR
jgi:hypothetical protein